MNEQNLQNRNEVKSIKFHHRVKRFYHKNLFRKIYTVAIVGLIAVNIFSIVKYGSFAEDIYTEGEENNNVWGGGEDSGEIHHGLNFDNREERQGPCPSGYHVPSIGEWSAIAIARCHQTDNNCNTDYTYENIGYSLTQDGIGNEFRSDFNMPVNNEYWSSSSSQYYEDSNEFQYAYGMIIYDNNIQEENYKRHENKYVRCTKPIEVVDDEALVSFTSNANGDGDYVLIYGGKKFTIAGSDLEGTYYWGANENTETSHLKCKFEMEGVGTEFINHGESRTFRPSLDTEEEVTATCYDGEMKESEDAQKPYGYGYSTCIKGEEWNTATLDFNDDGDYELVYDGKTYTIASGDQNGSYWRGTNTPTTYGTQNNNVWGGGEDSAENYYGFDLNNPEDRQGPCPSGYHVPSRGEWAAIAIAWCNQNNACDPSSDLKGGNSISKSGLGTTFKSDFGMSDNYYWSSSPHPTNGNAWSLAVSNNDNVSRNNDSFRGNSYRVRCTKNSIGEVWDTSSLGLTINSYGDYELIYNGKKYTIAGSDLEGKYWRGTNTPSTRGSDYNNVWGGGEDSTENGYSPNPTNFTERQGPCEDGWHVPSRGEWNSIVIAWSHLPSNESTSCSLRHAKDWTESNNLIKVYKSGLGEAFKNSFGMSDNYYWSSSPYIEGTPDYAWKLSVSDESSIYLDDYEYRNTTYRVRCLKNSTDDEDPTPSTFTLTFAVSPEGYGSVSQTSVTVDEGISITVAGDTVTVGDESVQATPAVDTAQYDYEFVNWTNNCGDTVTDNCSIIANFKRTENSNTDSGETNNSTTPSYSGRGGRGSSSSSDSHKSADTKDTTVDKNDTNVDKNDIEVSEKDKSENKADGVDTSKTSNTEPKGQRVIEFDMQKYNYTYTPEQNLAYQFAYQNKITTVSTIREAKMNTPLTRIEMAKMLSYYAMNVLGQIPDASIGVVKFRDVTDKMDDQYDNGVTLAYQLGIMGINMPNREFRPNDTVTRGEFATALSRMIYNDVKDGTGKVKYYEPHIAKLYKEGIINNTNPKLKELRGYVMTMLMRTEK